MTLMQPIGQDGDLQHFTPGRPITLSVHAMGGQGGGVLIDWIVALAEGAGFAVQATSVAGVAQRTGATLYYVEMLAPPPEGFLGRQPVLALMPVPGEVDLVIAAELMEAGRAIQRGLVTPSRTTLIASAHRALAVSEKSVPGDGQANAAGVYAAAAATAFQFVAFDMAEQAERSGSVISAALFGAIAGTGTLPFPRNDFEATIRKNGVGVEPSLRAFGLGYEAAASQLANCKISPPPPFQSAAKHTYALEAIGWAPFDSLVARARTAFPQSVHAIVAAGLRRTVDYQDAAYGAEYLDRLEAINKLDSPNRNFALTASAAKHIARAMTYDDVIRVADLKTRAARMTRIRSEVAAKDGQVLTTTEFMHPRLEELTGILPKAWGERVESSKFLQFVLSPFVGRPRRVQTGTIRWFVPLFIVGGLKGLRRGSLRHARERTHLEAWQARIAATAPKDYALAMEICETRRLIKGYGDTHARGGSKFDKVIAAADRLLGRPDAADWVRRLRTAALSDEDGAALDAGLRTIGSFIDG